MALLPLMPYSDGIRKHTQVKFGSYNHIKNAGNGEIYDMENLTSDDMPLMGSRKPRYEVKTVYRPNGVFSGGDGIYLVDGTDFYVGKVFDDTGKYVNEFVRVSTGELTDGPKTMAALGPYILIFPDKKYYKKPETAGAPPQVGKLESLDYEEPPQTVVFGMHKPTGTPEYDFIRFPKEVSFKVGDAVEISGTKRKENDTVAIIRAISDNKDEIRFYPNVFVAGTFGNVTVKRTVPDMDFICENENRIWGCKGSTLYASKVGDPFNFRAYDGEIASSSFSVNVGSEGDFTGCITFMGYPIFFKENHIYKVYGSKPANFQVIASASIGLEKGSHKSLAIAGETLFYLSRTGIMSYSGGMPESLALPFGDMKFTQAVGGSDGVKYYVSMKNQDQQHELFVFDTRYRSWHREDNTNAVDFLYDKELFMLRKEPYGAGTLMIIGNPKKTGGFKEGQVTSMAEFGDITAGGANHNGIAKLQLRLEMEAGSEMKVYLQFDSSGVWEEVSSIRCETKRSVYLPLIPRRSDHFRIRLEGRGEWRLYSLSTETYTGSEASEVR